MRADNIRRQLAGILELTDGAQNLELGRHLPGLSAAERRRALDDMHAGRHSWGGAHRGAERGLQALDRGDTAAAMDWLVSALWDYADALRARVQPEDLTALTRPSKKRGRPQKK